MPPLNGETISGRFAGKLLAQAVRSGIPVIVIDDSAEHVVESAGPDDGMRHTRVSTDQLVRLLYLARYGVGGAPVIDETLPVVETTVEWSQDAATYGVARIAVGFWHRRLWIVHERAEDSDADFIALLIRYTW